MAKLGKSDRVFFKRKGDQARFLNRVKDILKINTLDLSKITGKTRRTISGWLLERTSIPLMVVYGLCKKAEIRMPTDIEIRPQYWYTKKGASVGGKAVYKKYGRIGGDPEKRKNAWLKWWNTVGRFNPESNLTEAKSFDKPVFSEELAEYCGIMLGDGGISKKQLVVTLHYKDDKKYSLFVEGLIRKLFKVKPSTYFRKIKSVNDIVVSRSLMVKFCVDKLGLVQGNKIRQQIKIPPWIMQNRKFKIACLRGLIDTDGSIFSHSYIVKGKMYSYKKLSFTSMSKPLISNVFEIFLDLKFHPRITRNQKDVRLERVADVAKYIKVVGSHNPKHLYRYKN